MRESLSRYRTIFTFWYPLAATWLMMATEGPFLSAIIARLPDPKFNLAAFGVAFSFAVIIEAPIIMIMSASTALVEDWDAFRKLRNFTYFLNGIITVTMVILVIPPVFYLITETWMGLPREVSRLIHIATIIHIPWPAAIGFRRFFQGILIRHKLTRRVAYGTFVRLITMGTTATILALLKFEGSIVGAGALTCGVLFEGVASRIMVHHTLKKIKNDGPSITKTKNLDFKFIIGFYYPLALTSILALGIHPVVVFFMGKSPFAIESLAVLPVVNSLIFIFRSLGLSFQEVVIALLAQKKSWMLPLRNFAFGLSLFVTGMLGIIAFTPLGRVWFQTVSGLSPELTQFSLSPAQILVILPALSVWISFQRGMMVYFQKTAPVTLATIIEVGLISVFLYLSINHFHIIGAVAAAGAYIVGRLGANFFLLPFQLKHHRNAVNL